MFKLPEFPSVDCSKFDVNALDFRKLFPFVDTAGIKTAGIDASAFDAEKVTAAVRDAGYLMVGLGVVAVQQAQVARNDLLESITEGLATGKAHVESLLNTVDAGALLEQAREFGKGASKQVRDFVGSAA